MQDQGETDAITPSVTLSVVVPALDEEGNVAALADEFERGVLAAGVRAELIVVDDGSRDATGDRLRALRAGRPWLRVLRRDRPQGQSAAMAAGVLAARGAYVAFLDADLQNDPADLPAMLAKLQGEGPDGEGLDLVQGDRSRDRRDNAVRRLGSRVGRLSRRLVLGDRVRDTGCSARVLRVEFARRLPLAYRGMHRFVPATVAMLGGRVAEVPVRHRPRSAGETKYGLGLLSRGPSGLLDLLAVRWMRGRLRDVSAREEPPPAP